MRNDVTIRTMQPGDVAAVYALEQDLFAYPWPKCFFDNDLASAATIALVAEKDGAIIGYGMGSVADVELHVTNVGVAAEHQRRGLGVMIMERLEATAIDRGCREAYLEVRVTNTPAIDLYRKLGYTLMYERPAYYLDGGNAYVMGKSLLSKEEPCTPY